MIAAPRLRLFRGEQDAAATTATSTPADPQLWSVREAFARQTLPQLTRLQRAPGSIAKWKKAVWYWEHVRPDDPPICNITRQDLDEFPELLLDESRHLGIRTARAANQQLMYLQGILRDCDDILDRIPRGQKLPEQPPTRHRRVIKLETLSDIFHACHAATLSYHQAVPPAELWRAALVLLYNLGCRRCEAMTMPRSAWRQAPEFPDLPGFGDIDTENPCGWMVFRSSKTEARKCGLPLVLPVSETLARHLRRLDQLAPRRQRMFPVGNHPSTWRKQLRRIQGAAGIDPPFTFQEFRKTAGRAFRQAGGRNGRGVSEFMLGHSPRGVNARYYDDFTADAVEMIERLEQPDAFTTWKN